MRAAHAAVITAVLLIMAFTACQGGHVTRQDGTNDLVQRDTVAKADRTAPQNTTLPAKPAAPRIIAQGMFSPDAHAGSGDAAYITNGTATKLLFVDFQSERGAGMHIYLSTDRNATRIVDLGDVQGYKGTYEYMIPPGTDLAKYRYVLVWSRTSGKSFLTAELRQ